MFKCDIFLYCIQFINGSPCFLSLINNKFAPLRIELNSTENESLSDSIFNILDEYITSDPKFINPVILDIKKQSEYINIYYVCTLPIDNRLVNCHYIPYNIICSDPLAQKAMRYV